MGVKWVDEYAGESQEAMLGMDDWADVDEESEEQQVVVDAEQAKASRQAQEVGEGTWQAMVDVSKSSVHAHGVQWHGDVSVHSLTCEVCKPWREAPTTPYTTWAGCQQLGLLCNAVLGGAWRLRRVGCVCRCATPVLGWVVAWAVNLRLSQPVTVSAVCSRFRYNSILPPAL